MGVFRVSEEVRFCYGHRLMEYQGKCARIHGHNARVEIVLAGSGLNRLGFVADFADIEAAAHEWIEQFDHKLVLRQDDPVIPYLEQAGEAYVTLPVNPSAENFARLIYEHLRGKGHPVAAVRFWETETANATYEGEG
ncbi:6-pyruvoyl trahydropterin synthase family protein [Polyangium aurulentum]|uniref:6-pyruvoyl trahydropterin synthase family protein n=1 Tax=Polyangium aurulentum TaxID=2567896 RepID=UPI0019815801|nr:6-carboxytetrahydropterin synthase [Polyangium aurulentum]UQA57801.1 6-carboxytetrahydropterin synthase [Polyangium aurulentum]